MIYLLLDNEHYFAHHLEFVKLDKNIILDYFRHKNVTIKTVELSELVLKDNLKDSIIITLSSQKPYHKSFIDDVYEYFTLNNNILIPSKHMIKAHDNKGYQELYKKYIGLFSLENIYLNKDTINYDEVSKIGYPLVLKKIDGSGSKGVQLIKNEHHLKNMINREIPSLHLRYLIYFKEKMKNIFLRKENNEKLEYFKEYHNYVIQKFIPNLKFDYKVIIFFDKYYVLKRHINNNDFRASGSGNFEFIEAESALLEYCQKVFKVFNEPFMSLDICFDGSQYYLIEYQAIHFGPYTQIYSPGYYYKQNNKWHFIKEKKSLEEDIGYALYHYMIKNKLV